MPRGLSRRRTVARVLAPLVALLVAGCSLTTSADTIDEYLLLGAVDLFVLLGSTDVSGSAVAKPFISEEVNFQPGRYRSRSRYTPVRVFQADGRPRAEIEGVLRRHVILARFRVAVISDVPQLEKKFEVAAARTRELGGDALLVTRDSEIVGVIMQSVRYSGPGDGEEVLYALRRIDP